MLPIEPVKSSNLAAMAFDSATRQLHVTFLNSPDDVHVYTGVPEEVAAAMKAAPSVGAYFAKEVRGKFPHVPPAKKVAAT